jgi:hypothetical protein
MYRSNAVAGAIEIEIIARDIADVAQFLPPVYERAIGFFTLHHLHELDAAFRGLRECSHQARIFPAASSRHWS